MTVIAARIYGSQISFAADRQTTAAFRKVTEQELRLGKLAAVNGMTIGGAGLKSHSMWLISYARNHAPLTATEVDVSQFMLEFTEWMRKKEAGFANQNQFLIAYKKKLFNVFDSLSVFEVPEYAAIGSGQDFAVAAMHMGSRPVDAVKVAAELDLYCSGEVDSIIHT